MSEADIPPKAYWLIAQGRCPWCQNPLNEAYRKSPEDEIGHKPSCVHREFVIYPPVSNATLK